MKGKSNRNWLDQAECGYNYRLSELECALGRVQLGRIDEMLAMRRDAAERYDAHLAGIPGLELPPLSLPRRTISWFVYVIRLRDEATRDRVQSHLAALGIGTGRYFAPIHQQPAWRSLAGPVALSLTDAIAPRMLALPLFNRITIVQQREIAAALRSEMEPKESAIEG